MTRSRVRRRQLVVAILSAAALIGVSSAAALAADQHDAPLAQPASAAALSVPQVGQAGAEDHAVQRSDARQLCQPGAAWIRPHFATLTLKGGDTITLTGSKGAGYTLTARHSGRAFSTRSFAGDCVTLTPRLADPASSYAVDSYQSGAALADVVVAGAGDICGSSCAQTRDLVADINPAAVFTAGDNAYENGSLSDYNTRYHPTWGQFKSITHPVPGNHEYQTSSASGYFDYFNGTGNSNGPAGERGKGYYSWDIGDWHFVALNSNISMSAGSTQERWLRADLQASTKPCTAAYWHHPLFTRGSHSNTTAARSLWQALYDNKADLVLVGHDHNYQRYALQSPTGAADPNGIRQVLVGTGGRAFYDFTRTMPNVQASNDDTYGVLKLSLSSTGYTGNFVPVEGRTFTDSFQGSCHAKGNDPGPQPTVVHSDDFEGDKGWRTNLSGSDTATTGAWERGDPEQTTSTYSNQVKQLGTTTSGSNALSTGRLAGSGYGANDLDGGASTTRSGPIALPAGATLGLSARYNVAHGDNSSADDYLRIRVVDGTTVTTVFQQLGAASEVAGSWRTATANLSAYAGRTISIQIEAADAAGGSLFEAQVDDLLITKQ